MAESLVNEVFTIRHDAASERVRKIAATSEAGESTDLAAMLDLARIVQRSANFGLANTYLTRVENRLRAAELRLKRFSR